MTRTAPIAFLAALSLAGTAQAADWHALADTNVGKLSIDAASVKTQGAQTTFQYRVDFKTVQKNPGTGKSYRSTVTDAVVSCKERSMAMTTLVAYPDMEGKGAVVDRVSFGKLPLNAVVANSSDDLLLKAACSAAAPPPPAAAPAAAPKAKK